MIFDEYDFEVLRLCGLCRYMPTGLLRRFNSPYFKAPVLATLRNNGYIKMQSDKSSYKLTFAGREALAEMGYTFPEDSRMDLKRKTYQRKLKSALWNVLLHLAGIDVFADKTAKLAGIDIGYVTSLMLRADTNIRVLAGTRFLGILKMYDTAYIPYYIEGQEDWIVPKHEAEIYKSQVNVLKSVRDIQVIVTGNQLEELWRYIHPTEQSQIQEKGMKRFDEALKEFACDYLLVPTNDDGVTQLNIMMNCRYRERIAKAMGCSTEKVYNLSLCDGFKENVPYIIAVDFNVKRIVRALKQIERFDKSIMPRICCLPFQKRTIVRLIKEYKAQNCVVLSLDRSNIYHNIFNENTMKKQTPYVKEGGAYISANQRKITKSNIKEL